MQLAVTDLFKARWTDQIHEEWIEALLRRDKYDRKVLERTRGFMDASVRDAKVFGYEELIVLVPKLKLGNAVLEAPASSLAKLELRLRGSQAGAWEPYAREGVLLIR